VISHDVRLDPGGGFLLLIGATRVVLDERVVATVDGRSVALGSSLVFGPGGLVGHIVLIMAPSVVTDNVGLDP